MDVECNAHSYTGNANNLMLLICAACGQIQIMHLIIVILMICRDSCQSTFSQCRFVQFHDMKTNMFIVIAGFAYTEAIQVDAGGGN